MMSWQIPVYEGESDSQAIIRWQEETKNQNQDNAMPGRQLLAEVPISTRIEFYDEREDEFKEIVIDGVEALDKWNQKLEDAKKRLGTEDVIFVKKDESYGFRKKEKSQVVLSD